jgi:hypothetical protein
MADRDNPLGAIGIVIVVPLLVLSANIFGDLLAIFIV